MVQCCFVPQCKSKKVAGDAIRFHQFPANKQMVTRWLRALKSCKKPSRHAKVCSLHFQEIDYRPNEFGETKRYLKSNVIPSQNLPKTSHRPKTSGSVRPRIRRIVQASLQHNTEKEVAINHDGQVYTSEMDNIGREPIHTQSIQTSQLVATTLYYDRLSEEQFKRYTGLTSTKFNILYSFLAQSESSPFDKYLSKRDQLILCLTKYKQNIIFSIIGDMYGLSLIVTKKIFVHWTQIMNAAFKAVNWWSLRYKNLNGCTVILHCFEIATQHSIQNSELNQSLFSPYKNQNTLKYLIGIDEKGTVIFCSDVFCGSVCDRDIFKQSEIIDHLIEGDIVLADPMFEISDLLESNGVALNPPVLSNQEKLTLNRVLERPKIAKRRILIEKIISLPKFNKILSKRMPAHLWPYVNEIIFVSNLLNNFK